MEMPIPNSYLRVLTWLTIALPVFPLQNPEVQAKEGLTLRLSSVQNDYALREPMKFYVTLANRSNDTLSIVDVTYYDNNMEHFYLEVSYPDGRREFRKNHYRQKIALTNPHYGGEPLAPGDRIQTILYPTLTYVMKHPERQLEEGSYGLTFPFAGIYKVRAVYFVPTVFTRLWKGEDGELYSNEIVLSVREPTSTEREIIDSLWVTGTSAFFAGDLKLISVFDETALRHVIAKYPNHPMTRYARLYLAKHLVANVCRDYRENLNEAIRILEGVMGDSPDFRFGEVRLFLGQAYLEVGRREESIRILRSALKDRPALRDNYAFMSQLFHSETMDNIEIRKWIEQRRTGKKYEHPLIEEQ